MSKLIWQIIKFGWVGAICFVVDYGILYFLTEFFLLNYLISALLSFAISTIVNYFLSIRMVFVVSNKRHTNINLIIFCALSVIGLGLNQFIMWFVVEFFMLHYMLTKIISTFIVMVYNFVTRKLFLE